MRCRDHRGRCLSLRRRRICRRRSIGLFCRLCSSLCDLCFSFFVVFNNRGREKKRDIYTGGKDGEGRGQGKGDAYATNEPPVLLQSSVLYVFMQE